MSYALIKNIPLNGGLFSRNAKDKIDWAKYGLKFDAHYGTAVGRHADGIFHNIIFIEDEDKFNAHLPELQAFCDATPQADDSVTVISDADATDCKNDIVIPVDNGES